MMDDPKHKHTHVGVGNIRWIVYCDPVTFNNNTNMGWGSHIVVAWQSAYYYQLKTTMGRAEVRLLRVEIVVDYFVRGEDSWLLLMMRIYGRFSCHRILILVYRISYS